MSNAAQLNLVVIRAADCDRAAAFYGQLGLRFVKHRHGNGPEHFSCEQEGFVFEIYPRRGDEDSTRATRLGFAVVSVEDAVAALEMCGAVVVTPPRDSPWGCRAVVDDPDGHRVEITQQKGDGVV